MTAAIAPVLGPLGSVAAIVFGWAAHRELARSTAAAGALAFDPAMRRGGRALATLGLVLGVASTAAWGALLTYGTWTWRYGSERAPIAVEETGRAIESAHRPPEPESPPASTSPEPRPAAIAPRSNTETHEGVIAVIDLGLSSASLAEELARQRVKAAAIGQTLIVMTTRGGCAPCRGVDGSLRDPLMQAALAKVRLVRIDVEVFHDELGPLRIPDKRIPGFFVLAPDLSPKDGVDGGEWDDDVARAIAPVLGAFVRGRYGARREPWRPLSGSGTRI